MFYIKYRNFKIVFNQKLKQKNHKSMEMSNDDELDMVL